MFESLPTPGLRHRMRRLLVAAATLLSGFAAVAAEFTVAVVPQFPATEVNAAWTPALRRLSAQTGHAFRLVQHASIPSFESSFRAGAPDFVFLNPYHMVMARAAQGYTPLVRDGRQALTGVLVVAAASPLRSVEELSGRRLAFPAPNAFGASLYMRALLAERGIAIEPDYVRTHSNAYRQVLAGLAAAAGGVRQTLQAEDDAVKNGLRVLFETPPSAPHPLAAHPRVPPAVREAVQGAVLGWAVHPDDAALLGPIQLAAPVAADYERDYAPLERLGLQRFVVEPRP